MSTITGQSGLPVREGHVEIFANAHRVESYRPNRHFAGCMFCNTNVQIDVEGTITKGHDVLCKHFMLSTIESGQWKFVFIGPKSKLRRWRGHKYDVRTDNS